MSFACAEGALRVVKASGLEDLWDTADAAQFLGLPEKTLKAWRSKDYGPPYSKLGKHVRYAPNTVRMWAESRTITPDND